MAINQLSLSGKVLTFPKTITSPNGVSHCKFILEHASTRTEAGLERLVKCQILVQISGGELIAKMQSITKGAEILIGGFLVSQRGFNQDSQLVLHAEHIEFI